MSDQLNVVRLEPGDSRPAFSCGDSDLDDFYITDSIDGSQQLLSVTYIVLDGSKVIAFFSLSNDSIRKDDIPEENLLRKFLKAITHQKRGYKSFPAAKIGRLGIRTDMQRRGVGAAILDFLKGWFTINNKTGCRFLIVDAYNTGRTKDFYQKNGFSFLTETDESANEDDTRIMFFDLIKFRP